MKLTPRATLPLVLAPFLLATRVAVDRPAYKPTAGTVLSKHVVVETELELDDMTLEMNGQDMTEMAGQIELAMKISQKLTVTDRYETMGDGRPTKLKRTYDEVSSNTHVSGSNPQQGQEEKDVPLESALEGTTVVFSWNEDDSTYDVAFAGDEKGDAALLEGLTENLDLRDFLPDHEVAKNDTWEIPPEAVRAVLAPGGNIKLKPADDAELMGGADQFSQNDIIGELQGDFEGTYLGTRDEDGTQVARIGLKIKARSAQDMTDRMEDLKGAMQGLEGAEVDVSAFDGEFELEAEGEVLWDLQAGHVHSLSLSGETRMIVDMSMNISGGGRDMAMEISQTFAGTQTLTLTTGE